MPRLALKKRGFNRSDLINPRRNEILLPVLLVAHLEHVRCELGPVPDAVREQAVWDVCNTGSYQGTGFSRAVKSNNNPALAAGPFLLAQISRAIRIVFGTACQAGFDGIVVNVVLMREETLLVDDAHFGKTALPDFSGQT
jgi:hypothetical protein